MESSDTARAEPRPTPRALPVRVALYVFAALAAAAALFVGPALEGAVRRGAISGRWLFLPIGVYGLFLLIYAADRAILIRRRRYPVGKALFQIAFALLFALLLLPSTIRDYQSSRVSRPKGFARLAVHGDPEVRAAVALATAFGAPDRDGAARLLVLLEDDDAAVRAAAAQALARWSGLPEADTGGIRAWASALSGAETSTATTGDNRR